MPTRNLAAYLLAVFFFISPLAVTQDVGHTPKPKIGLVLEGGGALGMAHIGVLQWLEEHHIPVSYVAGTSMGGLVGGIYATGHSPAQMRYIVSQIDWQEVLSGDIPFPDLAYRRKQDAIEYPNGMEFGLKKGIQFREGFNSGHQVGLLLDRIALPYGELKSFNDLPTPFACVATDLISARRHVFRAGSLAQALRSTMSLPGVFSPVRTSESIFVDGGLLDNLPVDVAKDMGADLVVAVQLQNRNLETTASLSSVGVLGQSISVVVAANELSSMEKADILISVPLTDYTSMDYNKYDALIQKGYAAAASKSGVLSAFSVDEATWQEYLAQRYSRRKEIPTPQFVEVVGTKPALAQEIKDKLSPDLGKPVDSGDMDRQLTEIAGIGRFSRLGYRTVEKNNQEGLLIQADEKQYGPPIVRPLIYIDGSESSNVQFVLGARITFFDVGAFGSEWRNDVAVGSQYGLQSEFFRPFGKSRNWFLAPRAFASDGRAYYYKGSTLLSDYRNREAGGGIDLGYSINRSSELRLGYEAAHQWLSPTIGLPMFGKLDGRIGVTSVRYNFNERDDPVVPRKGFDLHSRAQWTDAYPGARSGFPLAETQMTLFRPVTERSSVYLGAQGGTTFSYHPTGLPSFSLGGNESLVAYGANELLTNQYFLFKAGYIHEILELPPIVGDKLYAVGGLEGGKIYGVSQLPMDAFGGVIVKTFLGPVLVGASQGATGHHKVFFRLGRIF